MVVNVVKLLQELINQARTGDVPISPDRIVFQRGGRGGRWFLGIQISREEAMELLKSKAQGIKGKLKAQVNGM